MPRTKGGDFATIARTVVEKAIGERLDGSPLPDEQATAKNSVAVELGRKGGLKGGKARAAKLSSAERTRIAKKAAARRWKR